MNKTQVFSQKFTKNKNQSAIDKLSFRTHHTFCRISSRLAHDNTSCTAKNELWLVDTFLEILSRRFFLLKYDYHDRENPRSFLTRAAILNVIWLAIFVLLFTLFLGLYGFLVGGICSVKYTSMWFRLICWRIYWIYILAFSKEGIFFFFFRFEEWSFCVLH